MPNILALDQGTTGSTALVIDAAGQVIGSGYRELPQFFPAPGEVEHDPADILTTAVEAGREAVAAAGVAIDAVGITNQRETVVAWDAASLTPVGRAIVWQDRRTSARCAELRAEGRSDDIRRRTGLLVDPYFSATKIEWILRDAAIRDRAARGEVRIGTVESWLVANLTGGAHLTDRTNASRTMLADLRTATWDDELLHLFGVPRAALPEIVPSAGSFGVCRAQWFGSAIPICGLAGDQQAALYAQGCETAGAGKVTYGTGAFLLRHLGSVAPSPAAAAPGILTTVAATAGPEMAWASEGSVFVAGAAVQWLRDGLGLIEHASDTARLAASVPDTGGVVVVPAFTGIGAPHWNAEARGTITGITRGTTAGAHRAGSSRGDCAFDGRPGRCDGRCSRASGRWRGEQERLADAGSGRPARIAGGTARCGRAHCLRRCTAGRRRPGGLTASGRRDRGDDHVPPRNRRG